MSTGIKRTQRDYTLAFKLAAVEQVEKGELTYKQAQARYGVQGSLYRRLLAIAPTVGARIAHAMALARAEDDATLGLRELDAIDVGVVERHQPWWAARAHLLMQAGHASAAIDAFDRAGMLTVDPAQRRYLAAQAAALSRSA